MSDAGRNPLVEDKLFGPGRKRVLALDGGGCRGIVTIAFLEQIETLLREETGNPKLVLSDFFDMIGGTSVGSMLATMLALGYEVREIKDKFLDWAPKIFSGRVAPLLGMRRFDARQLSSRVHTVVKEETLGSLKLKTGLTIVSKRVDTGSPWVTSNNSRGRYYENGLDDQGREYIGNRHFALWRIIRASTAAPFLFTPHEFEIYPAKPGEKTDRRQRIGTFVDGGISPYNNPALQLALMAGLPGHNLNWAMTPEDLLIISIGTGHHRIKTNRESARTVSTRVMSGLAMMIDGNLASDIREARFAAQTLRSLVSDGEIFALKMLQSLSHPRFSWRIDGEVGNLHGMLLAQSTGTIPPLFAFQRYNLPLEMGLVDPHFDVAATLADREQLYPIDDPGILQPAYRMAREAAESQVSIEDFSRFL